MAGWKIKMYHLDGTKPLQFLKKPGTEVITPSTSLSLNGGGVVPELQGQWEGELELAQSRSEIGARLRAAVRGPGASVDQTRDEGQGSSTESCASSGGRGLGLLQARPLPALGTPLF